MKLLPKGSGIDAVFLKKKENNFWICKKDLKKTERQDTISHVK